jgi:hypothetical protein
VSSVVIHGVAFDRHGLHRQTYLVQGRHAPELRHRAWHVDPLELRSRQPRSPLNIEHGERIGEVIALERSASGDVYATAVSDHVALLRDWDWYLSPEIDATIDYRDVIVRGVGLTREPAQGRAILGRVTILAGDITSETTRSSWQVPDSVRARLDRAGAAWSRQRYGHDPIVVTEPIDEQPLDDYPLQALKLLDGLDRRRGAEPRPHGGLWHGGAARRSVISVR